MEFIIILYNIIVILENIYSNSKSHPGKEVACLCKQSWHDYKTRPHISYVNVRRHIIMSLSYKSAVMEQVLPLSSAITNIITFLTVHVMAFPIISKLCFINQQCTLQYVPLAQQFTIWDPWQMTKKILIEIYPKVKCCVLAHKNE